MEQQKIDRISAFTRLARERTLTPDEQTERATLRAEYIAAVKASLTGHLENVYYVDEDGSEEKLKPKKT